MTRPDGSKDAEKVLTIDKIIEKSPEDIYKGNDPVYERIKDDISKNK